MAEFKQELWRSDGTRAGTRLVAHFPPWLFPRELTNVDGTLFFALDGRWTYGSELWKSDGTRSGTRRVDRIGGGGSFPAYVHVSSAARSSSSPAD